MSFNFDRTWHNLYTTAHDEICVSIIPDGGADARTIIVIVPVQSFCHGGGFGFIAGLDRDFDC